MRSRVLERRRRGGEVGADEAAQGVPPDGRGDGVPAAADGEQVAVVDLGRAGRGGERPGGAAAEGAVAREHRAAGRGPGRPRPRRRSDPAPASGAATPASPRAAASPKPSPTSTTAVASRSIDSDRSHASAASGDSAGPVTDAPGPQASGAPATMAA